MTDLLFISPVFKQVIWGGNRMRDVYGYDIPGDDTGECWAVSAHENGDDTICGGEFDGWKLSELYAKHQELFGDHKKKFPLLIKIIDAKADLSVQVHPDDAYASIHENGSLGKTECWYILDCDPDATIVIGHNAKTKEELADMIHNDRWDELITPRPIKKGDFFQIVPGTVHAIKAGTLILETQQSSDITYRLYDYGRLQNGKPRQLHIEQSIDVINCPHKDVLSACKKSEVGDAEIEEFVDCEFYKVWKTDLKGKASFDAPGTYRMFSVIDGEGKLNGREIKKGQHFIMPLGYGAYTLEGNMSLISSEAK
jgi:mannose-6-phosphate isomerase class I